ncbi:hypothetical protein P0L94_00895 [Microbacter sp. GSS18]|nr:hypothetical protein P0L94_00895 [Microbacter sp. GSS18]
MVTEDRETLPVDPKRFTLRAEDLRKRAIEVRNGLEHLTLAEQRESGASLSSSWNSLLDHCLRAELNIKTLRHLDTVQRTIEKTLAAVFRSLGEPLPPPRPRLAPSATPAAKEKLGSNLRATRRATGRPSPAQAPPKLNGPMSDNYYMNPLDSK